MFNKKISTALIFSISILAISLYPTKAIAFSNPATVPLLTVGNFAALSHTLTSSPTGPTVLNNGDLGVDVGACTGFISPCTAPGNGTINSGSIQLNNAVALQGQIDATAAVTNIGSRPADQTLSAQLGGQTLTQGVYEVPASATNLTGDLTLSGDANSVFIFHLTSTLITDNGSRVLLTGGVQACNVFWKVDSAATFNGTTQFVGTVLAQTAVTFPAGGATLNGRAVAQTGAITLNNTTINNVSCASVTATPTMTPSPTNTLTPTPILQPSPTPTPTLQPSPSPSPTPGFVFPACVSVLPKPGDKAHYTTGFHQIIGGSLLFGSDDVYSLAQNNFLQCFCPATGNLGIQTNWLRTTQSINGWFFVNGSQWNLGNFSYAAQNVSFSCQSTPSISTSSISTLTSFKKAISTPTPTKKPKPTPKLINKRDQRGNRR